MESDLNPFLKKLVNDNNNHNFIDSFIFINNLSLVSLKTLGFGVLEATRLAS